MLENHGVLIAEKNIKNILAKHAQTVIKCAFLDIYVNY